MRTAPRTIRRRPHERNQRFGPGLAQSRIITIGETLTTLPRNDVDQFGLFEEGRLPTTQTTNPSRRKIPGTCLKEDRPIRRSYWRQQPYGPRSSLRRFTLIDVRE